MSCGSVSEDSVTRSQDVRAVGCHTLAYLCTIQGVGPLGKKTLTQGCLQQRTMLWWEHGYLQYLSCAPLAFALDHFALQQHSGASRTYKLHASGQLYTTLDNPWFSDSQLTSVILDLSLLSAQSFQLKSLPLAWDAWVRTFRSKSTLRGSQFQSTANSLIPSQPQACQPNRNVK